MRGRLEDVRDVIGRTRVYETLGQKYFGTSDYPKFIEIYGHVDDARTVYVRLVPEDGLTWEY